MVQSYILVSQNTEWFQAKTLELLAIDEKWDALANNPDIHHITSKKSIGIEEVRDITTTLSRKPFQETYVAVIIEDANTLTIPAQNALLKLLEEPPEYAKIILWTPKTSALIPTILSRCFIIEDSERTLTMLTNEDTVFIIKLANASPGERLALVAGIGKDITAANEFIEKLLTFYQQKILAENTNGTTSLHTLIKLKAQLSNAVSPKFLLDIVALQLPKQ